MLSLRDCIMFYHIYADTLMCGARLPFGIKHSWLRFCLHRRTWREKLLDDTELPGSKSQHLFLGR